MFNVHLLLNQFICWPVIELTLMHHYQTIYQTPKFTFRN